MLGRQIREILKTRTSSRREGLKRPGHHHSTPEQQGRSRAENQACSSFPSPPAVVPTAPCWWGSTRPRFPHASLGSRSHPRLFPLAGACRASCGGGAERGGHSGGTWAAGTRGQPADVESIFSSWVVFVSAWAAHASSKGMGSSPAFPAPSLELALLLLPSGFWRARTGTKCIFPP